MNDKIQSDRQMDGWMERPKYEQFRKGGLTDRQKKKEAGRQRTGRRDRQTNRKIDVSS